MALRPKGLVVAVALAACRGQPGRVEVAEPDLDSSVLLDTVIPDSGEQDTGAPADSADSALAAVDGDADGFAEDGDCDDGDATVYPGAPEDCSTVDHDCDGEAGCDADDAWATVTSRSFPPYRDGRAGDFDGDGLSNREEYLLGTDPAIADTDGDGVNDGNEVHTYGTNPTHSDAPSETIVGSVNPSS